MGQYFLDSLRTLKGKHNAVQEVRGKGLLIGMEFKKPVGGILDHLTAGSLNKIAEEYYASLVAAELLKKHQVITAYTLNNPNVMRLEPPLIVEKSEIDYVLNALEDVLSHSTSFFSLAMSAMTRR